jgi:pimeloyl-ACP methyl ester carboxylesterase
MIARAELTAGPALLDGILRKLRLDRLACFYPGADGCFRRPGADVSDALVADALVQIVQPPLQAQTACLTSAVSTDLTAAIEALSIPVLLVRGDVDVSAQLPLIGEPTAELLPHADLLVYPGAPHGLYVTDRERPSAGSRFSQTEEVTTQASGGARATRRPAVPRGTCCRWCGVRADRSGLDTRLEPW